MKAAGARKVIEYLVSSIVMLSLVDGVYAAQWRSTKGISVDTTYTDNTDLEDDNEQGELSLGVRPSLGITGRGARLNLDFSYAPGLRFRSENSTSVTHNGAAGLNTELYRDVLFFDASANARQTLTSSTGRNGGDDVNNNDDTTQTYTYSVSPYMRNRFGSYADSILRYTYNGVINTSGDTDSSTAHILNYGLTGGVRFPDTPWSLSANYSNISFDDGDDRKQFVSRGTVGYVLNRIWQLDLYGIYEDYDADFDNNDDNGLGGGAGFTWTPSERTFLRVAYGYRVTGWNAYMDFSHRSRRSTWTASLTHDIGTSRDEQLAQQTFDEDGNPIFERDAANLERGDELYTLDRFQTGYRLTGIRNSLSLTAHISERDYQTSGDEERNYGARSNFSHSLSGKTSANLQVGWGRSREDSDDGYDTDWTVGTGLTHRLGARTRLNLSLRHRVKDADDSSDDYTENRISLTLNRNW